MIVSIRAVHKYYIQIVNKQNTLPIGQLLHYTWKSLYAEPILHCCFSNKPLYNIFIYI